MTGLTPACRVVIELLAVAPRGPRRDGLFALWLVLRVLDDLGRDPPFADRSLRRRVTLLERRLTSLALPLSLKRAFAATIGTLKAELRPSEAGHLLLQLVSPVKDGLGQDAADAVHRAARGLR
ncbi:MAG: hypothetical protein FJ206_06610 [Gemmatimonadetes bacterium]|nr:hypothetical protein [Gemmatimonadota bacterium]